MNVFDTSIMHRNTLELHLSHFSGTSDIELIRSTNVQLAPGVADCFPLGSVNTSVYSSIDWVAKQMIDMCTLEGKHLACISLDSLDTSYILCDQWHDHLWFLYDALSIHGWTWDHHPFLEN